LKYVWCDVRRRRRLDIIRAGEQGDKRLKRARRKRRDERFEMGAGCRARRRGER
jgi:hypothetical protein